MSRTPYFVLWAGEWNLDMNLFGLSSDWTSVTTWTLQVCKVFCSVFSKIVTIVLRAAFDSVWVYFRKLPPQEVASGERMRRYITTSIWFSTSLLLAVVVPNIGDVISLLGGLAAVFVFSFPGT